METGDHQPPIDSCSQERTRVAVCLGRWLPASETFIYDQLQHQKRTAQWVLSRGKTAHAARFPYPERVNIGPLQQLGYFHLGVAPSVSRAFKQKRPQVIHAHFGLNGTMVLPFAQKSQIPLVVSFHGHDVGGLEPQNKNTTRYGRYQKLAPAMFDYASTLLCASHELAELLATHGAPESKIVVHQLGIDVRKFVPPAQSQRSGDGKLLLVGRLVEKKGIEYALEALSRILPDYPQAHLTVIGEGPLRGSLMRKTKELGLTQVVSFLGSQTPEEVRLRMSEADIMLTPSVTTKAGDRESGVIVLKEAGAMELPTVATQHGGIPEIVEHERSGYLVPERDVDALTHRLRQLLGDPALRRRMGECARQIIATQYDTLTQNGRLEDLLIRAALD